MCKLDNQINLHFGSGCSLFLSDKYNGGGGFFVCNSINISARKY